MEGNEEGEMQRGRPHSGGGLKVEVTQMYGRLHVKRGFQRIKDSVDQGY